jgi:hypothetical protein
VLHASMIRSHNVQHSEFSLHTPMPSGDATDKNPMGCDWSFLVATQQDLDFLSNYQGIAGAATLTQCCNFTLWFQTYGTTCIVTCLLYEQKDAR